MQHTRYDPTFSIIISLASIDYPRAGIDLAVDSDGSAGWLQSILTAPEI